MRNKLTAMAMAVALLLSACDPAPAPSKGATSGFAGLGGAQQAFASVSPGAALVFPRDHYAHPDYRIEWWYVTANLHDAQGNHYGVQWTLFRSALAPAADGPGWNNANLWLGHAGLTTATQQYAAQRLGRGGVGQAGVAGEPWHAWIDDWTLASTARAGDPLQQLRVQARDAHFAYDLQLHSERPLVLQGEQGYSRKSDQGQASWYYSQPFLQARGQLTIDGRTLDVEGSAWLDREWSSQYMAANQQGWDWFSLHLQGGRQLMLFRLRHADGRPYLSGNWIEADGRTQALQAGDIELQPLMFSNIDGHQVPTAWSVKIPGKGLDIRTQPLNERAWMGLATPYWEGPIRFVGSQEGEGYLEMTGY
ncbi:lipocalin-like domain-containing protein [Pseudomonas sp. HR96]|uniref:lipocalin-like domain-containing protein n=1 Tax=Pseudomonas sp. HR96 TaxID=1027966 RepID=UPI002A753F57|nr:lipocalin-like domain-containing protein [Pseudomonas sp. HR96]WPP01234.1 lipocalin-like domain-containing protein [Pseudomonas sp. HR96]